jgi:hypothetical protein
MLRMALVKKVKDMKLQGELSVHFIKGTVYIRKEEQNILY